MSQEDIRDHSWDFPDLVNKESFDLTLIDERCAQRVDRSFLCFRDVNLQVAANRPVGRTFAFSGFFQRFVINHDRNDGCKHLCDPECVPYAIRTHKMGQKICGGHDNDHIAEKGNYKGLRAFSKAFHGTGSGNGYSRNKKAGADDLQCSGASGNGFRGSCEKSHKLSGCQEADNGSKEHDHTAGFQGEPEDFFHTLHLTGTEVITDQRAHSLDDSVGREIQEGLQFVINAKDHHIAVRVSGQHGVQKRDQKRWQCQVQDRGNTDGIQAQIRYFACFQGFGRYTYRNRLQDIKDHIDRNGEHLADASSQSCAPDTQLREKADSPDQERVQDDVADTSHKQGEHGYFHPSYSLEKFFEEKADGNYCGKQENDGRILQPHPDHGFILGVHLKEYGHNSDADHSHQDPVDHRQKKSVGCGSVCHFFVACAKVIGNSGVDSDPEANGNGVDHVLDRIDKGQGGHGLLADLCHEEAVHNIV